MPGDGWWPSPFRCVSLCHDTPPDCHAELESRNAKNRARRELAKRQRREYRHAAIAKSWRNANYVNIDIGLPLEVLVIESGWGEGQK